MDNNLSTLKFLKDRLEELVNEYNLTEKEQKNREIIINSMKTTIQAISNPSSLNIEHENGVPSLEEKQYHYDENLSWRDKIISYMKFKNKAVTTSEVVSAISALEKEYTPKQILNLVSGTMSSMVKERVVKTYKPKKMKGFYYANPLWFHGEPNANELQDEYKPETKEKMIW